MELSCSVVFLVFFVIGHKGARILNVELNSCSNWSLMIYNQLRRNHVGESRYL